MTFSNKLKRQCAQREVQMRIQVYGRRVKAGTMNQQDADHQIAVMKAIVDDYRALEAAELKGGLVKC
jgi:hypothetical protein